MLIDTYSTLLAIVDGLEKSSLNPADLGLAFFVAVFLLLLILESRDAKVKNVPRLDRQSYLVNLGTFLINDTLMSVMSVSSLLFLAEKFGTWGFLRWIASPAWQAILSFLLFDLTLYAWHRANHSFDSLWMFHKVHHSDPTMNVSTAFRLHFVEVVFTTVVKAVFVVLSGVQASTLLANELLVTLMVMFHHANLSFKGEQFLKGVVVVPGLHRIHHSTRRTEHDNNYGAVFSVWDRLFGSYRETGPVAIGLASVPGMGVLDLMRFGLSCDWIPLPKTTTSGIPRSLDKMIAEAAYYRAEKRGFTPGFDRTDWLEAEREIIANFTGHQKGKVSPPTGKA